MAIGRSGNECVWPAAAAVRSLYRRLLRTAENVSDDVIQHYVRATTRETFRRHANAHSRLYSKYTHRTLVHEPRADTRAVNAPAAVLLQRLYRRVHVRWRRGHKALELAASVADGSADWRRLRYVAERAYGARGKLRHDIRAARRMFLYAPTLMCGERLATFHPLHRFLISGQFTTPAQTSRQSVADQVNAFGLLSPRVIRQFYRQMLYDRFIVLSARERRAYEPIIQHELSRRVTRYEHEADDKTERTQNDADDTDSDVLEVDIHRRRRMPSFEHLLDERTI